ncbi:alpha-L-fucosidase [Seonamhaeicola sp.]|uniref:alpha-L-fucosidase n=1 Tax=Seonamhaeicola sp. TaxID=1912245 RepID=UPI002635AF5B|nr:alpha-L-fucosidase [Seonamhaeicola sp.]
MRKKLLTISVILLSLTINAQKYEANWESLQNYTAPEWYEDAKLGFWVHWGVYSVPAFKGNHAAEWYGRWMYSQLGQSSNNSKGLATHLYHNKTYGSPDEFGYKDFIPMFKAENFNANEWAELCVRGGAKFFTMMGAHHDSFCMWDTKLSKWNSVNMGPKKDLVGEIAEAVRKKGLKFGVSNHTAWNYDFFSWNHINRYDAINKENEDLYGNPIIQKSADTVRYTAKDTKASWVKKTKRNENFIRPSKRDMDRWLERTKELAGMYSPDLYYFDWGFNPSIWDSRKQAFGAFYYNHAVETGQGTFGNPGVVLNYKSNAFKAGTAVKDFERGGMKTIADMVWQTDDCVYDDHNWGFVAGTPIKPTNMIVDQLMDIISKRGVLMLSFAPKADGTFPEEQKQMMYELGDWLKVCGEAVYKTRPYKVFGEIGSKWEERNENNNQLYIATKEDIRFTRNKENNILYATVLEWPGEIITIKSLADIDAKNIKAIKLLGTGNKLKFKQTKNGLEIKMPKKPSYNYAYPLRITFKNHMNPKPAK